VVVAALLFAEVVAVAQFLERSPATFFQDLGYALGCTCRFGAETTNPLLPWWE